MHPVSISYADFDSSITSQSKASNRVEEEEQVETAAEAEEDDADFIDSKIIEREWKQHKMEKEKKNEMRWKRGNTYERYTY